MSPRWFVAFLLAAGCYVPAETFHGEDAGSDMSVPMLATSVPAYDFGTIVVGTQSSPASIAFTNIGDTDTLELGAAVVTGAGAVLFVLEMDNCHGHVLAPHESCAVTVKLAPASAGDAVAALGLAAGDAPPVTVAFTGKVVTPGALRILPGTRDFGSLPPNDFSPDATFTATNTGGASTGTIAVALSGSDANQFAISSDSCNATILPAGGMCTIKLKFAPTSAGTKASSLTATSAAAGVGVVTLGGRSLGPAMITVAPAPAAFGDVVVTGASSTVAFVVTNSGELPSGPISAALGGVDAAQFTMTSTTCGTALPPAGSCAVQVAFTPSSTGFKSATFVASATPGGTATSGLSGTGIPPAALVFTPSSNTFAVQDVGTQSAPVTFTLQNTGGQDSSTITSMISGASSGDFLFLSDTCAGQTLAPNATCAVAVVFLPTAIGSRTATLRASAGTGGITTASLAGTGRDKVTLTVTLAGGGNGTVTPSTGTLSCAASTCSGQFYRNSAVTLTAVPNANMVFLGWSGACTGTGTCTPSLASNANVTATFATATQRLQLAVTSVGTKTGTISASPSGVSCGASCLEFPTNQIVTLTAVPTGVGSYFGSWQGDCVGSVLTCVITMNAGKSASATFSPANLVFVTSGTYVPSPTSTIAWADGVCQTAAQNAGLTGNFIGWIGAGAATWSSRIGSASGWLRLDGKPFAASKVDLVAGHSLYPNVIDEHGVAVSPTTLVNSGLSGYDCNGWTQTGTGYANPGYAGGGWSMGATYAVGEYGSAPTLCGTPHAMHCVQVDYSVNVTYPHASGRFSFIARQAQSGSPGVAGLDAACNMRAASAGLPGAYRAVVASTTASAASRFSTAGMPWVRTDGIPLAAAASDVFAPGGPNLLTTIDVDENGAVAALLLAIGAYDLQTAATAANNCTNYMDSGNQGAMANGYPSEPNSKMVVGSSGCGSSLAVWCLQQ